MKVTVNGAERDVADGLTLGELVRGLDLEGKPFAVELNREVVRKARLAETTLKDGDRVEIVTLVGGG
jgi:thiamine biosynthesis protein ThiS